MSDGALPVGRAIALGVIQGPAELLPVSSSAHIVLIPWLADWDWEAIDPEVRKSFEVALHTGAAAALLIGQRKLIAEELAESSVVSIGHRPGLEAFHSRELVLVAGEDGAELRTAARARSFRDIYKQIATIDHAGAVPRNRFWTGLRDYLARQRKRERQRVP